MSKPKNRYRPESARRSHAAQQQAMATCPECGKRAYTSKPAAKNMARLLYPGAKMRVYSCPGTPWWHITSQDAARVAEFRDRQARPGGPE